MNQFVTHDQLAAFAALNDLEVPADFGPTDPADQNDPANSGLPLADGDSRWVQSNWATDGGSGTYLRPLPPPSDWQQPASKEEGLVRNAAAADRIQSARDALDYGRVPKDTSLAADEEAALLRYDPQIAYAYADLNFSNKVMGWT